MIECIHEHTQEWEPKMKLVCIECNVTLEETTYPVHKGDEMWRQKQEAEKCAGADTSSAEPSSTSNPIPQKETAPDAEKPKTGCEQ